MSIYVKINLELKLVRDSESKKGSIAATDGSPARMNS